jgi:hypothetical protein
MASKNTIAKLACIKIGSELVTNVETDNTKRSRTILTIYEHTRDVELSKSYWKFARKRIVLSADPVAPAFGWGFKYNVPADFLRVFKIRCQGNPETVVTEYDLEGKTLLTDYGDGIYLEYIGKVENENDWHPLFHEVMACKLGVEICYDITDSGSKRDRLLNDYKILLAEAKRIDAVQLPPRTPQEDDYILGR